MIVQVYFEHSFKKKVYCTNKQLIMVKKMARAQFDRDEVIQNSTKLFWRQGFNGSSMQQIVKVTGLKPGSLYLAFGNKEGLYHAALEQYATQSEALVKQTLQDAPSVGEGICQILLRMIEEASETEYCSCFLINSQLELAGSETELLDTISLYLARKEALYAEYLQRDYPPEQAKRYATSIMLHVFGIRVYGYLKHPRDNLIAAVQEGLPWLPW